MSSAIMQAKVVNQATPKPNQAMMEIAFFSTTGAPLFTIFTPPTAATMLLTGYVAGAVGALSATDSVNVAFRKLAARMDAAEAATAALDARVVVLEGA